MKVNLTKNILKKHVIIIMLLLTEFDCLNQIKTYDINLLNLQYFKKGVDAYEECQLY